MKKILGLLLGVILFTRVAPVCANSSSEDQLGNYIQVTFNEVGEAFVGTGKIITYTTLTGARIVVLPFRVAGTMPRTSSVGALTALTYFGMRWLENKDHVFSRPDQRLDATNIATGFVFTLAAGFNVCDWLQCRKTDEQSTNNKYSCKCKCKKT